MGRALFQRQGVNDSGVDPWKQRQCHEQDFVTESRRATQFWDAKKTPSCLVESEVTELKWRSLR